MTPCWVKFYDNGPFVPTVMGECQAVCSCGWESKRWAMVRGRYPRELRIEVVSHLVRAVALAGNRTITPDVQILLEEEEKQRRAEAYKRIMEDWTPSWTNHTINTLDIRYKP